MKGHLVPGVSSSPGGRVPLVLLGVWCRDTETAEGFRRLQERRQRVLEDLRKQHNSLRAKMQFQKGSDPLGARRNAEALYSQVGQQIALMEGQMLGRRKYNQGNARTR